MEVSADEDCSSDEDGSDLDNSLEGFINNATQASQTSQSVMEHSGALIIMIINAKFTSFWFYPYTDVCWHCILSIFPSSVKHSGAEITMIIVTSSYIDGKFALIF